MKKQYRVFYISGATGLNNNTPRYIQIIIKNNSIHLERQIIPFASLTAVDVKHDISNTAFSKQGLAMGSMMGGTSTALMMGSGGGKRVDSNLLLQYKADPQTTETLIVQTKKAEELKRFFSSVIVNKEKYANTDSSLKKFFLIYFAIYRYAYKLVKLAVAKLR